MILNIRLVEYSEDTVALYIFDYDRLYYAVVSDIDSCLDKTLAIRESNFIYCKKWDLFKTLYKLNDKFNLYIE